MHRVKIRRVICQDTNLFNAIKMTGNKASDTDAPSETRLKAFPLL